MERYAIEGDVGDWGDALKGGKTPSSGLLSVKRKPGSGKDDERTPSKSAKKEGKKEREQIKVKANLANIGHVDANGIKFKISYDRFKNKGDDYYG